MQGAPLGLIDNWLRHIQDVADRHRADLDAIGDSGARFDRLCELNVVEQAANVVRTSIVQEAWRRGQPLAVHGWIYALRDGLLRDLRFTVRASGELAGELAEAFGARGGEPGD
jgi:carbonic anhydrase